MTTRESPRLAAVIDQLTQRTRERDCARAVTAHYLGLVREAEEREKRRVALPVLRTCGDCAWRSTAMERSHGVCDHPDSPDKRSARGRDAVPAQWCPLRQDAPGGQR